MAGFAKIVVIALLPALASDVWGHSAGTASSIPRYRAIKNQFDESLSRAVTDQQRIDSFRDVVARGRYAGSPMLDRMFNRFSPDVFKLAASTPGLSTTVGLLASHNPNLVSGHARTLRYAHSIAGDPRFKVEALNQPRNTALGKTDADIVFRHRPTGQQSRMEVKNVTPTSQRANLRASKNQILKMAADARTIGEIPIWANRQRVVPEIRDFAERNGVKVVERLRTGQSHLRQDDVKFSRFLDELDGDMRTRARLTTLGGSVRLGTGAYLVYQALRQLDADLSSFGSTRGEWLLLGEHSSLLIAGGGFATAGPAQLALQMPRFANSSQLLLISRWGGRVGWAGMVLTQAFVIGQYASGHLTERQFWHSQASVAGGFTGAVVGAKGGAITGGAIGSVVGPLGTKIGAGLGALIGGIAAGSGGAHFAGAGVAYLYQVHDRVQHEQYVQFLRRHYGAH